MVKYDVDLEIREYQWRRKFETSTQHHCRALVLLPITAVMFVVLACSTYWW